MSEDVERLLRRLALSVTQVCSRGLHAERHCCVPSCVGPALALIQDDDVGCDASFNQLMGDG